jgi:hypothetical protein
MYNTIFLPTLCYQCQTWSLTATEKRKIVTTEMKCLRRILNVSRLDNVRNEIIRQQTGVTHVLDYIKKQQLKWFGYVSRSSPNGIIQRALKLRYNGGEDKGTPRRLWIDDIADTTANIIQQIIPHGIVTYSPSPLYVRKALSQTVQHALLRRSIPRCFTAQVSREKMKTKASSIQIEIKKTFKKN